jgi:flavodoxin
MKSLVVYSSQSGHTKKLAEVAYDALPDGKEITPVDEAPDPAGYDFVAVGFWLKGGSPDPKSVEYLKKRPGPTFSFLPLMGQPSPPATQRRP